jgi:hypothetical protein
VGLKGLPSARKIALRHLTLSEKGGGKHGVAQWDGIKL